MGFVTRAFLWVFLLFSVFFLFVSWEQGTRDFGALEALGDDEPKDTHVFFVRGQVRSSFEDIPSQFFPISPFQEQFSAFPINIV